MAADGARTWILTGSPDNHAATAAHGYAVIGCEERMHAASGVIAS